MSGGFAVDGQAVRRLRVERGLSTRGLAAAAGVSVHSVTRAERGQRVTARTLRSLAEALGVPVAAVLPGFERTAGPVRVVPRQEAWAMQNTPEGRDALCAWLSRRWPVRLDDDTVVVSTRSGEVRVPPWDVVVDEGWRLTAMPLEELDLLYTVWRPVR